MCQQCITEAEDVTTNLLPGYTLMRARVGSTEWPAGWFGLVRQNDPDFVFPGPLTVDPFAGLSDEEINARADELAPADAVFDAAVRGLQAPLATMHAVAGYELVTACQLAGYDIARDGTEIAYWLMHYLAKPAQTA